MFFSNSLAFLMIQRMLAIWSLVPLPFLKPAWTSGSSRFMYSWSLAWRILSITLLVCADAAAKSLQSCPTLCSPIDGSPPGSPVPGILQARTLEWVACPPPGDLPDPGIQPISFGSCTAGEFFTVLPLGKCRKWQNENFNPHQLVSKANAELKGSFKAN